MHTVKTDLLTGRSIGRSIVLMLPLAAMTLLPMQAVAQSRLQAGVLVCAGDGNWGATIDSNKPFQCTYSSTNGEVRGAYSAEIQKFSADVDKSGNTVLIWMVSGPSEKISENYEPGGLEGTYVAVDSDSPQAMELSADALIGVGPRSIALQPVSVQVQTGLSVATGVNTLVLNYVGPKSASAIDDDASSQFNAGWDDPSWIFSHDALAQQELANGTLDRDPVESYEPNSDYQLGNNQVRFAPIAGAPGAEISPQSSNVTLGVGLAPRATNVTEPIPALDQESEPDPLGNIDNGFAGTFSLGERRDQVTKSMSITTPLTEGSGTEAREGKVSNEVRTMFGLGLNF